MKYLKIYEEFTRSCHPDSNLKKEEVEPHTAEIVQQEHDKKKKEQEEQEERERLEQEALEHIASNTTVTRSLPNS